MAFLAILMLAMPPLTHAAWNRTEPWLLGLPFLYAVLLAIYLALIAVLFWTWKRGV